MQETVKLRSVYRVGFVLKASVSKRRRFIESALVSSTLVLNKLINCLALGQKVSLTEQRVAPL